MKLYLLTKVKEKDGDVVLHNPYITGCKHNVIRICKDSKDVWKVYRFPEMCEIDLEEVSFKIEGL